MLAVLCINSMGPPHAHSEKIKGESRHATQNGLEEENWFFLPCNAVLFNTPSCVRVFKRKKKETTKIWKKDIFKLSKVFLRALLPDQEK